MDITSRAVIDLLRTDERLTWIVDQLVASFTEGIAQSAKETGDSTRMDPVNAGVVSTREKTKREKYETSRPYSEEEKVALIEFALHEVFVTLPSIQAATATALAQLGSSANAIEFAAPDDEERIERSYTRKISPEGVRAEDLRNRFEAFRRWLAQ